MRRTAFLKLLQTVDKLLCKDKMGFWGEAPSKVAGAAAPDNKPGTDAGRVCKKALHDAEPTKHTQPFNKGKGLGVRDREIALLIKK